VWLSTADCRGTAKSKLALGVVRPPVVMIGRYSSSAPQRKKTLWLFEMVWSSLTLYVQRFCLLGNDPEYCGHAGAEIVKFCCSFVPS